MAENLGAELVRLYIAQALAECPQMRAGSGVLLTLLHDMGCPAPYALLLSALDWLETTGLVTLERISAGGRSVTVAALTMRGLDAARGRERVTGVMRPLPEGV